MTGPAAPVTGGASSLAVRLRGIGKSFPVKGGGSTEALQGIDLDIAAGEFISLIGPSGCGKSTLLRIVGDLITPSGGTVEVNGKPATQARLDRDYGMVFQAPVLFDWRSVEANVRLPLEIVGVGGDERDRRVREMLELVELSGFAGHYPHQLSGGMQQRVAIARALALEPALLLMDEPFGALDEMTRERLNAEVLRIWQQTGKTVIFVTHSIPEAVFLSTRVVVMSPRPGRIAEVIAIDLAQPRDDSTRESERYYELVTEVREALRGRPSAGQTVGSSGAVAAPATAVRTKAEGPFGVTLGSAMVGERARRAVPSMVVFVVGVMLWELWASGDGPRIVPPPSAILSGGMEQSSLLLAGARATLVEAIGGLLLGAAAGVLVAFAAARWVLARDALLPLAIAASTIPLIAVAPIINNWFGSLNPFSKVAMAALLVFFPITVNVTRGLVDVTPAALELMRSYAASDTETLRKVRVPNMLPFFFTALKVGTTLAFIGAIVAEYFGGTSQVLGYVILNSMYAGRFDVAWAGILLGAAAAIVAYLVIAAIERAAIPWYVALRSGTT